VLATTFSPAFDIVFGVFVVATVSLVVLTVRFAVKRDRQRRK